MDLPKGYEEIVEKFKTIRENSVYSDLHVQDDLQQGRYAYIQGEAVNMRKSCHTMRVCATKILSLLDQGDEDYPMQEDKDTENILDLFAMIWTSAREMLDEAPHPRWRSVCRNILLATCRIEELLQRLAIDQLVVANFEKIWCTAAPYKDPDVPADSAVMWDCCSIIRQLAHENLSLLGDEDPVQNPGLDQDQEEKSGNEVFAAVHQLARDMVLPEANFHWRSACRRIIRASRRAEQLLKPLFRFEVLHEESEAGVSAAFTHPTATTHEEAPVRGNVTEATWNHADVEGMTGMADISELPEEFSGQIQAEMLDLEHKLLEVLATSCEIDSAQKIVALMEMGHVTVGASVEDLVAAKKELEKCLQTTGCWPEDTKHRDFSVIRHALGEISLQLKDLMTAEQQLEKALQIERSLVHGKNDRDLAKTLFALGQVSRQSGDFQKARQHLEEALRMYRSWYGGREHYETAVAHHALGQVSRQSGDFQKAKQHLEEALRMYRSWYGGREHYEIALTLRALGQVSRQSGDLAKAKQHLEEALRMHRSWYGERERYEIAVTLYALGQVSRQSGDLAKAKQHLEEALEMYRSWFGSQDRHEIALTLHTLGQVSRESGDLQKAKQHLVKSLQMKRSLNGGRDDSSISVTLQALGQVGRESRDLKKKAKRSSRMKHS